MKYVKFKSLTWWSAFAPLITGVFIAADPVHGLSEWTAFASNAAGMSAPALITLGLGGIGLRGAVG